MGGMPPMESGKKAPEGVEGKETELVPYGELLTQVGEQMGKVVSTLEEERKLSGEIRAMGGKVTRETADRIMDLERQKNGLLEVYQQTLEPARKDAFAAFLDRQELAVEKPMNFDELMTDPETLEVTDDMLIEVQTSEQLAGLEKDLAAEADKAREEMVELIEQMHAVKNEPAPKAPDLGDPEIRKAYMGVLQSRYNDLKERSKYIKDEDTEAEMKQLDAVVLPMMAEDVESAVAAEKAADAAKIKEAYVAMLQGRFDELHSYVRGVDAKLKEVRFNLGFAKKMDQKEGRAAA